MFRGGGKAGSHNPQQFSLPCHMSYNHLVFHATTFLSYDNYFFLVHSNCDSEKSSYVMQKINISISKFKFWFIAACLPPLLMRGGGQYFTPPTSVPFLHLYCQLQSLREIHQKISNKWFRENTSIEDFKKRNIFRNMFEQEILLKYKNIFKLF